MNDSSIRRGEWLEIPARFTKDDSVEPRLSALGIPLKLIHKLKLGQGIRLKSDRILLHLFPQEFDAYEAHWLDIEILYEDDFCMVVNKPAGLKVHSTHPNDELSLGNAVAAHYEYSGQNCRIRHIHRLDEHTSGAVLYAKNELAQLTLDEHMRSKLIQRQYIAFVHGKLKVEKGIINDPIGRDRHHPSRRRVSDTGDEAMTRYEQIQVFKEATLLRLQLDTGRTHQIRVHLSHILHPILGDRLYGGAINDINRQALHGDLLQFPHPFFQRLIEVEATWPHDLKVLHAKLQ